jgi:small-conductance mechanosensitive channel
MSGPIRAGVLLVATASLAAVALPTSALAEGEARAAAAEPVALPEPLTKEAVEALVARLSDAQVRELLLAQLGRAAAARSAPPPNDMMGTMEAQAGQLRDRLTEVLKAGRELPGVVPLAARTFVGDRPPARVALILLLLVALLGCGWAAERLFARLTREMRRRLLEAAGGGIWTEAGRLLARLALELLQLLAYAATVILLFFALWQGHVPTRHLFASVLFAVLIVRAVSLVTRFLLAPTAPALRLLPFDDVSAGRLSRDVVRLGTVYAAAWAATRVLRLYELSPNVLALVGILLALLIVGALLNLVWRNRAPIATVIRGPAGGSLRGLLADLWPVLATAYVLIVFAGWLVELLSGHRMVARGAAAGSLLLAVGLPLVDMALSRLVAGLLVRPGTPPSSFVPVLQRGVHIVVLAGGLALLARLWNLDLTQVATRSLGGRVAQGLIDVAVALLLGYLAWELVRTAIDWRLARERKDTGVPDEESEGLGGTPGSRLATVLPLIRMTAFVAIVLTTAMIALASLGVNIAPLLAGAGVLGLAIGFGAQTLVKDVVGGIFFLIDDAFRMGEYIQSGDYKGTVEAIGLRALKLRHHRGPVYIVPYGSLDVVQNTSRDWVIDKMTIGITYDSDLEKARKLIKKIGQELAADPEFAPNIIEPLKMQGVEQFGDFAIQIRVKMKTKPNEQFPIRRRAYTMIKKAFDANGIRFAFPTVQVAGGGSDEATAAAARQALEQIKSGPSG